MNAVLLNVSLSRHITPTLKYKLYTIAQTPHELWQIWIPVMEFQLNIKDKQNYMN